MARTKARAKQKRTDPAPDIQKRPAPQEKQGGPAPTARTTEPVTAPDEAAGAPERARTIGRMQQRLGNTRLSRMLGTGSQAKLLTDGSGDRYAQEADRQANLVQRVPKQQQEAVGAARGQGTKKKPKITTPLGKEWHIKRSGTANAEVGGVDVKVKPDLKSKNRALKGKAETKYRMNWKSPGCQHKDGIVTSVDPVRKPDMAIQTTYGPGVTAESPSQYGRGTTPEDIKAGQTSLGFHEARHGLDYIQYLKQHPLPQFEGKPGMTIEEFKQAQAGYDQAMDAYQKKIHDYSVEQTDCVGVKGGFCKDMTK